MDEVPTRPSILLIDDDENDGALYSRALVQAGLSPSYVRSSVDALAFLDAPGRSPPDLVLLDVHMPRVSGIEFLPELRRRCPSSPIVFLTGESGGDQVLMERIEQGADDWVSKSADPRLLVTRLHALLRRRQGSNRLACGELEIDMLARSVHRAGRRIEVSNREFDLLRVGFGRPGHLWSRAELLERVWGIRFDPETNVVNVHVARLRAKLERHGPRLIHTVRGEGYVFGLQAPPEPDAAGEGAGPDELPGVAGA